MALLVFAPGPPPSRSGYERKEKLGYQFERAKQYANFVKKKIMCYRTVSFVFSSTT